MKCQTALLPIAILVAMQSVIHAQIIRDMTPERIREAIALGTKAKDLGWYKVQEKARFSWPPLIAYYTTPFLRVALAANDAKQHYKTFTASDVTPDMTTPQIVVYAPSQAVEGAEIANVETIVVLPHNAKDPSRAVHPAEQKDASEEYKNLVGFTGEGRGIVAIFPIDVWQEGSDVHVVFDKAIPSSMGPNAVGGCTDCKSHIYLKNVF